MGLAGDPRLGLTRTFPPFKSSWEAAGRWSFPAWSTQHGSSTSQV